MPTRLTNANGTFLSGLIDDRTGLLQEYAKVTDHASGGPMKNSLVDGTMYRKIGEEYFKKVAAQGQQRRVNVLELGLVADGITDNSPRLREAMEKLPRHTEFYFPSAPQAYHFEALPAKYNVLGTPCAIFLGDSGASIVGESQNSTVLGIGLNCIGIQITGGQAPGITRLSDFSIYGPGQFRPTSRPPGTDFKFNLINGWGQFHLHNVNVSNAADGHGICVYGDPEVYIPLPPLTVAGRLTPIEDGTPGFIFTADNPEDISQRFENSPVIIDGVTYRCQSGGNGGLYCVDALPSYPAPGRYVATISLVAGALIADNSALTGIWNSDFNTGCGVFLVGADGNQTNLFGGSVRENGDWGVRDRSFLGTFLWGTHGSRNGRATNRLGIDNIFGNDSLTVGSFFVESATAASVWVGCYSEQGNQGPDYLGTAAVSINGLHGNGTIGPGIALEAGKVNRWQVGERLLLNDGELALYNKPLPNIGVTGIFSGYTPPGGTEQIRFTPQNIADVSKAVVGQRFIAFGSPKTITAILPDAWLLGPPTPFYPPLSPITTPVGGTLIVAQPPATLPMLYKDITTTQVGFVRNNKTILGLDGSGIQTPQIKIGEAIYTGAYSVAEWLASLPIGTSVRPGTVVHTVNVGGPTTYRCIAGGTLRDVGPGYTATVSGTNTLSVSADLPGAGIGQFYSYGGVTYEQVNSGYFVLPALVDRGVQPLTYAQPVFVPEGFGVGLVAQRPLASLSAMDAGWRWLDTATGAWSTWTGAAWVQQSAMSHTVPAAKQTAISGSSTFPVVETDAAYFGKEFTTDNGTAFTAYTCRRVGDTQTWKWYRTLLDV